MRANGYEPHNQLHSSTLGGQGQPRGEYAGSSFIDNFVEGDGTVDGGAGVKWRDALFARNRTQRRVGITVSLVLLALVLMVIAAGALGAYEIAGYLSLLGGGVLALMGLVAAYGMIAGLLSFSAQPASNVYLGSVLDQYSDAIALADVADGAVEYGNRAFIRLTGGEAVLGYVGITGIFKDSDDFQAAVYRVMSQLRGGDSGVDTVRIADNKKSGFFGQAGASWVRISAYPVHTPEGRQKAVWRFEDVTRERAEHEHSFAKLVTAVSFLDRAPIGLMTVNNDGNVVYANDTVCRWLGVSIAGKDDEVVPLASVVIGSLPMGLDVTYKKDNSQGDEDKNARRVFEVTLRRSHQSSLEARVIAQRTFNASGGQLGMQLIVLERESADAVGGAGELGAEAVRLLERMPAGVAIASQSGSITYANEQFNRLFGSPDLVNQRLSDIVPADVRGEVAKRVSEAAPETQSKPIAIRREIGKGRSVYLHFSALRSSVQGGWRVAVFATDVTEQFDLEQKFAQSQRVQAVGQLAGGIAHDFNNLLTAIIGFSDLLIERTGPTDSSFQDILKISDNAKRAAELVNRLLAFSRKQNLAPRVIDLNEQLAELQSNLNRLISPRVALAVNFGRDLWSVKVDAQQIDHVIMNLAVNARDAMPNGGELKITTSNVAADKVEEIGYQLLEQRDYVLIEVADTGVGISSSGLDQIFEPFYTTKDVGKGTGLGLSTVYGFIKQSGGFIFVESTEGKGTNFLIFLPRSEEQVESERLRVARATGRSVRRAEGVTLRVVEAQPAQEYPSDGDVAPAPAASSQREAEDTGRVVISSASTGDASEDAPRTDVSSSAASSDGAAGDGSGGHLADVSASEGAAADMTGKGTVLLVEDEDAVRVFSSRALRSRGYAVLEATSGEEALEIMADTDERVSVVVSDVVMPQMNGPTMVEKLRESYPKIEVIFVSGYPRDAFDSLPDGDDGCHFLPKPYSFRDLVAKVKEVTEKGKGGKEASRAAQAGREQTMTEENAASLMRTVDDLTSGSLVAGVAASVSGGHALGEKREAANVSGSDIRGG